MPLSNAKDFASSVAQTFVAALPATVAGGAPIAPAAALEAQLPQGLGANKVDPLLDLVGIPQETYDLINSLLAAGKRHLIFYGPPGTGKTTLACHVADTLAASGNSEFVTATSNLNADYLVGGYQPIGGGEVGFRPGLILRKPDSPLVIDELNRCNTDIALGPLFSLLASEESGQTTLPLFLKPSDPTSPIVTINFNGVADAATGVFNLGPAWRLVATMNTIDKTQLNQFSYALSRRFGWVYVGVPVDLDEFFKSAVAEKLGLAVYAGARPPRTSPIAQVWTVINKHRPLGGAPFRDMVKLLAAMKADIKLWETFDQATGRLAVFAFHSLVAPLLTGMHADGVAEILQAVGLHFAAGTSFSELSDLENTLKESQL